MTDDQAPTGVSYAPLERFFERLLNPFEQFVHRQSSSGILLMLTTFFALVCANSWLTPLYFQLRDTPVIVGIGTWILNKPLLLWVNDLLMAFFFFVVGLELKRELLFGELASPRKAALPLLAAIGGMAIPALIYSAFNGSGIEASGWAIPMATDIAFAIGVLVLLGNRVPKTLMVFLVAIAIIDDLGAVIVISLFYSKDIQMEYLAYAGGVAGTMFVLNRFGVRKIVPYFLLAMGLWYVMLKSGVHPTLAGVIGAFMVPAVPKYNPEYFSHKTRQLLKKFDDSYRQNQSIIRNAEMREIMLAFEYSAQNASTVSLRLEHIWHLPVAFLVVPVFAFFNAGISLTVDQMMTALGSSVFQGTFWGLLLGKFIGIFGLTWIATRLKILELPEGLNYTHVAGMSLIAGIGFTMSIFISSLAFSQADDLLVTAKAGIFAASLTAGILGYLVLRKSGIQRS